MLGVMLLLAGTAIDGARRRQQDQAAAAKAHRRRHWAGAT
jgi:hypothetical protein